MKDEDKIGKTFIIKKGKDKYIPIHYIGRLFVPRKNEGKQGGEHIVFTGDVLADGKNIERKSISFFEDELEPPYNWKKL